ncbi:MAG: hypothetical protein ACOCQQ_03475, partial [Candidatus Nanoarchaeia archaeon]
NKIKSIVGSYDTHQLCKRHKLLVQPLQETIKNLVDKGFVGTRSCFPLTSIKTTADFKTILECLRK